MLKHKAEQKFIHKSHPFLDALFAVQLRHQTPFTQASAFILHKRQGRKWSYSTRMHQKKINPDCVEQSYARAACGAISRPSPRNAICFKTIACLEMSFSLFSLQSFHLLWQMQALEKKCFSGSICRRDLLLQIQLFGSNSILILTVHYSFTFKI